jgi:chromate transporter
MMRRELVERRRWLSDAEFLDLVGASSVVPGPTSTEVAMYAGRRRGGLPGLIVGGLMFILPAAAVMLVLAWAYQRYGTKPSVADAFEGIKPVVVAVVAQAVVGLGRTAVKSWALAVVGAVVVFAYLVGLNEPVLLLAAGAAAAVVARNPPRSFPMVLPFLIGFGQGVPAADSDLPRLFAAFFKVGALLFGSGYVLFAFLRRDLVLSHGWLTESQLLDAIAVGQFTPGPLFTTATFIGYLLEGVPGAVVATVAIFLPAFLLVGLLDAVVTRMRRSSVTSAALDGLNVAAVAVMIGVTWSLARDAVVDVRTGVIALVAAVILIRWPVNAAWLIGAGAIVGLLTS